VKRGGTTFHKTNIDILTVTLKAKREGRNSNHSTLSKYKISSDQSIRTPQKDYQDIEQEGWRDQGIEKGIVRGIPSSRRNQGCEGWSAH
jgi:hypothetical protein